MNFKNKNISKEMFDIRPQKKSIGFVSQKKESKEIQKRKIKGNITLADIKKSEPISTSFVSKKEPYGDIFKELEKIKREGEIARLKKEKKEQERINYKKIKNKKTKKISLVKKRKKKKSFLDVKRFSLFLKVVIALVVIIFLFNFFGNGFWLKNKGEGLALGAFLDILSAKDEIKQGDFRDSYDKFEDSYEKLDQVAQKFDRVGGSLINVTKYFPYLSKVSSSRNLVLIGKNFSEIGMLVSESLYDIDGLKNQDQKDQISYLEIFMKSKEKFEKVSLLLKDSQEKLNNVNVDDVPEDQREKIIEMKKILPEAINILDGFLEKENLIVDILGGYGPRKYLFLFQNNQELRATGGFIGSYGLLDIFNGKVRKFFIDGIFNPDGQFKEKVVPPIPIQKISTNWSLHDSNWFPDFPESAKKSIWFYEKTGGPTVDGVIAITPTIMQKLLEITGPIKLEEYSMVIDQNNFIEKIQQEVEVNYDKELNQPKKIIADLAPKMMERLIKLESISDISKVANVLLKSLNEKHILMYSQNQEVQGFLSENSWTGEILETENDYLSVINTNINGYKTDGVVSEKISHQAEIQMDGTVIDTVTIKRTHNGGDTNYDWWNKVNADYMRVYVPRGSELLSVEGHTREINTPPLNYDALKFTRDKDVKEEEDLIEIDSETGTRIYEDAGKTVFANWVYVSPKESVTVKYVYVLPFKVDFKDENNPATYSLLAQKQSGSFGSDLDFKLTYPQNYNILWRYPESDEFMPKSLIDKGNVIEMKTNLKINKFFGVAFSE